MGFYKAFSESRVTSIGRFLVNWKQHGIVKDVLQMVDLSKCKVLEIGPGRGTLSKKLQDKGAEIELIEPSPELRTVLKELGFKKIFKNFVPPIESEDNSYDVVFLMNVLEHMNDQKTALDLLKEIRRVLKKNGVLVTNTPDALFWGIHFWSGDYTHNYVTTKIRLAQMFTDYDFEILCSRYYSGPLRGYWTPLISIFMKYQVWVELIPIKTVRTKLIKFRNTFLSDVFFIVQKNKNNI